MSRYSGNTETCRTCGITYESLRTGLDFKTVRDWHWSCSSDPKDWKYKRRGTVLGRWHAVKKQLWAQHQFECSQETALGR